ncbi:hypothetical protein BDR04DRAFT_1117179 [Suillus decipiens]|nr:hypothetical protein BDR04DRAFT_1117179 [Suillus decipiens]
MAPRKRLHSIWILNLQSKKARVHIEQSADKKNTQVVQSGAMEDVECSVQKAQKFSVRRLRTRRTLLQSEECVGMNVGKFLLEKIDDAPVMSICTDDETLSCFDGNDMDAGSKSDDENEAGADDNIDQNEAGTDNGIHACACNYSFELRQLPTVSEAHCALKDLWTLLKPLYHNTQASELSPTLREHLTNMENFFWLYTDIPSD